MCLWFSNSVGRKPLSSALHSTGMQEKGNASLKGGKLVSKYWFPGLQMVQLEFPTPFGLFYCLDSLWDALFSACRKREMLHVACKKVGNLISKYMFPALQLVQLEFPRFPLVSFTFWVHSEMPFSLLA